MKKPHLKNRLKISNETMTLIRDILERIAK